MNSIRQSVTVNLLGQQLHPGCGCSTVAEHAPQNLEVVGLNPDRCWTFFFFFYLFLLSFTYGVSLIIVPQGGTSLTVCREKKMDA